MSANMSGFTVDSPADVETTEPSVGERQLMDAISRLRRGQTHAALAIAVDFVNETAIAHHIPAIARIS